MRIVFEIRTMLFLDRIGWKFMFSVRVGRKLKAIKWLIKEVKQVEEEVVNNTPKMDDPILLVENPEDFKKGRKLVEPEDM